MIGIAGSAGRPIKKGTLEVGISVSLSLFNVNSTNPNRIYFNTNENITTGQLVAGDFSTSSAKTVSSLTIVNGASTGHYLTMSASYVGEDTETVNYTGTDANTVTDGYVHNDTVHSLAGSSEVIDSVSKYWNGRDGGTTVAYVKVYYPTGYKPAREYPAVMEMQGLGQDQQAGGGMHIDNVEHEGLTKQALPAEADDFLLFTWGQDEAPQGGGWMPVYNLEQIKWCCNNFPVDRNRCLVTGLSLGANMAYLMSYSTMFGDITRVDWDYDIVKYCSFVIPRSATFQYNVNNGGLILDRVHFWILHGMTDNNAGGSYAYSFAEDFIDNQTVGTKIYRITGFDAVGHSSTVWYPPFKFGAEFVDTDPEWEDWIDRTMDTVGVRYDPTNEAEGNIWEHVRSDYVETDRMYSTFHIQHHSAYSIPNPDGMHNVPIDAVITVETSLLPHDDAGNQVFVDQDVTNISMGTYTMIELHETNLAGADVAFTAVVTEQKKITVTPTSNLSAGTVYFLQSVIEDVDGNKITQSFTFTAGANKRRFLNFCGLNLEYTTDTYWNNVGSESANEMATAGVIKTFEDATTGLFDDEDGTATTEYIEVLTQEEFGNSASNGQQNGYLVDAVQKEGVLMKGSAFEEPFADVLLTGTSGNLTSILVGGVEQLSATIPFNTSLTQTALDAANNINANIGAGTAARAGDIVRILESKGTLVSTTSGGDLGSTDTVNTSSFVLKGLANTTEYEFLVFSASYYFNSEALGIRVNDVQEISMISTLKERPAIFRATSNGSGEIKLGFYAHRYGGSGDAPQLNEIVYYKT